MQEGSADQPKAKAQTQRSLAIGLIALAILTAYSNVIPVFATRISRYFSLSVEQYGTMIGLGSLGQMAALLLAGLMIARFGVRRIAEVALVGTGGCFVLIGLGASLPALKASMALHGLFAGLSKVSIPAFLIALYPESKRRMISIRLVAFSAVGILVPLWANQLLKWSQEGGDRVFVRLFFGPFLMVGCLVIAGGLVLAFRRQHPLSVRPAEGARLRFRELFRSRSLTIVLLVALHASADGALFQFLPLFMEHHFQDLPLAPAWALAGHNLAYLVTRTLLTLLPEGYGQRRILTLAGPFGGSILLVMLWQGHGIGVPLLYTLASLFFAAEFPVIVSEISSRSMAQFGTVLAGGMLASNALTFAFLKGTGRLIDTTSDYRLALSLLA